MSDEIRMMTYVEAGRILGIKPESVTRRARNRRWRKEMGNDGFVRIGVPVSIIPEKSLQDNTGDISVDVLPDAGSSVRIASLETEVRMLREALLDIKVDRDAWRDHVQRRKWWPFSD